ncbi:MarR family transcriptional regulator [Jatrophihabitans telluris]|uniref:MarR family transcriptional regulator n=1 Tax=Jatrophihabitans telluris TaxID=2038343 RepID=A0ABY4R0E0_9ACTN|nr:MarR family transcriptional regulator [Jatrophihabitans telluris]UQX88797.1 MarR family transcriptional regulator [Jatrophihabitans telluris]
MTTPSPPAAESELAAATWAGLRSLVLDKHSRRTEITEALGMSFIRAKALRRLARGELSMRALAQEMATDASYTTLVVDDLCRRGFVTREPHPSDRRRKIVRITDDGRAAAAVADQILAEPPASLLDLSPADLAALNRIVGSLVEGR